MFAYACVYVFYSFFIIIIYILCKNEIPLSIEIDYIQQKKNNITTQNRRNGSKNNIITRIMGGKEKRKEEKDSL